MVSRPWSWSILISGPIQPSGTYFIWTIGCQMNAADSARLEGALQELGYSPADGPKTADVVVLNTCVVRQSAEDRAIGRLTSLKPIKRRRPQMVLALMGCLVGIDPDQDLQSRFPYVDLLLPPSDPGPLVELLRSRALSDGSAPAMEVSDSDAFACGTRTPWASPTPVSAYVPIIHGCNHRCSYCIVTLRRGRERSRPFQAIYDEANALVKQGSRDITLLGQIVDRYGYDLQDTESTYPRNLADLLRALHDIPGLWRLRFLTSHPSYLDGEILQAVRELPRACRHIEIPVQSGHDDILARMRRGYTTQQYRDLVNRTRRLMPDCGITSDVIVGFPGETQAQFEATLDLLRELRLDKVHVAAYSPRTGTSAARDLADDVDPEEKQRRLALVDQLQEEIVGQINSRFLGQSVEVLVDDWHRGKWRARTETNKLVFFSDDRDWRGRLARVHITWTGPWSMQGEVLEDVSP